MSTPSAPQKNTTAQTIITLCTAVGIILGCAAIFVSPIQGAVPGALFGVTGAVIGALVGQLIAYLVTRNR